MMLEFCETTPSFDGTPIFTRFYRPKAYAKGVSSGTVVAVHGLGEHSGRYRGLAQVVCRHNFDFVVSDLRGHGSSGPRRGDCQNLQAFVLDIVSTYERQQVPVVGVLGHSFGGLLATYASSLLGKQSPPLFLSSPCYGVLQSVPLWKKRVIDIFSRFAPTARFPLPISFSDLSQNPENNAAAKDDPLYLSSVTARLGHVFLDALETSRIETAVKSLAAPVTIVAAQNDRLVDSVQSKRLSAHLSHPQSSFHPIDGAGHEIFHELPVYRDQAIFFLNQWLERLL